MKIAEDRDRWLTTDAAIAREALAHPERSPHLVAIAAGGQSWAMLVMERWDASKNQRFSSQVVDRS